jgi:hypothetical protein
MRALTMAAASELGGASGCHRAFGLKLRGVTVDVSAGVKPLRMPDRCPLCQSADIRRSQPRWWDRLLKTLLGWKVFRCGNCQHRFHKRSGRLD